MHSSHQARVSEPDSACTFFRAAAPLGPPPAMVLIDGELLRMNVVENLNASSFTAEKSKPKAGSRQQPPQQRVHPKGQSVGGRVPVPAAAAAGEDEQSKRKDHVLQRLRELLAAGNRRFEAIAVVLQLTLAEVGVNRVCVVVFICTNWNRRACVLRGCWFTGKWIAVQSS